MNESVLNKQSSETMSGSREIFPRRQVMSRDDDEASSRMLLHPAKHEPPRPPQLHVTNLKANLRSGNSA
jgi:hypothetical protein